MSEPRNVLMAAGKPVRISLLGGSISQQEFRTARHEFNVPRDQTWHAIVYKWLELTFTQCGLDHLG
jgi:hypothetical protein